MDRISKALEIASRNRQGFSGYRSGDDRPAEPFIYTTTETVPVNDRVLGRNRVLNANTDIAVVDAYRLLRTRVLQRMQQNGWKTFGVTSAMPKEGKTLTAVNLGISLAKGSQTVLLVDADPRNPSIHKLFGLVPQLGLGDYLLSGAPVERILVNPGIDRFVLLPGRPGSNVTSEHLASSRMEALVDELKWRYRDRVIIFDLPPVLIGDEVVAVAPFLDALLMVTADGETGKGQCRKAFELLEGCAVLGTVLNKSSDTLPRYGDYY